MDAVHACLPVICVPTLSFFTDACFSRYCSHSIILISSPLALIICIWGMTSNRMLAHMRGLQKVTLSPLMTQSYASP